MPSNSSYSAYSKHSHVYVILPRDSGHYTKYVQRGFSYNTIARGVTKSNQSTLEKEEQRIYSKKKETLTKLLRLKYQEEFLREYDIKILRRSLKTLDKLDEAKAREKAEMEHVNTEEASIESKPIPLDSDLATTIKSFNPLDPFQSNFQFLLVIKPSSYNQGISSKTLLVSLNS